MNWIDNESTGNVRGAFASTCLQRRNDLRDRGCQWHGPQKPVGPRPLHNLKSSLSPTALNVDEAAEFARHDPRMTSDIFVRERERSNSGLRVLQIFALENIRGRNRQQVPKSFKRYFLCLLHYTEKNFRSVKRIFVN